MQDSRFHRVLLPLLWRDPERPTATLTLRALEKQVSITRWSLIRAWKGALQTPDLGRALERLFAAPVVVSIATPQMARRPLFPVEAALVERAVSRRRLEFALGRAAAREALSVLGAAKVAIPATDRAPQWPTGFIGSITHCDGFCAAVAAASHEARALGFDAEPLTPLETGMANIICSTTERQAFAALPRLPLAWEKLAFSAKEAFYKAFHPLTGRFLDFLDVAVDFHLDDGGAARGGFTVRLCCDMDADSPLAEAVMGRWFVDAERAYCGATVPRSGDAVPGV